MHANPKFHALRLFDNAIAARNRMPNVSPSITTFQFIICAENISNTKEYIFDCKTCSIYLLIRFTDESILRVRTFWLIIIKYWNFPPKFDGKFILLPSLWLDAYCIQGIRISFFQLCVQCSCCWNVDGRSHSTQLIFISELFSVAFHKLSCNIENIYCSFGHLFHVITSGNSPQQFSAHDAVWTLWKHVHVGVKNSSNAFVTIFPFTL